MITIFMKYFSDTEQTLTSTVAVTRVTFELPVVSSALNCGSG
jgi:hypothetical protein